MANIRKPKPSKRARAKTTRVPRPKIPNRSQVQTRVPDALIARFDAAVKRAADLRADPAFNRTDAMLEAMALWIAREDAKGGA